MSLRARIVAAVVCTFLAAGASAHHSPARYDLSKEVFVTGKIGEVRWTNPHIYLTIDTTGPDGVAMRQLVEVAPISTVQTTGLRREHLAVGTEVTVRAAPSRRGAGYTVIGRDVTLADGLTYPLNPGGRESTATRPTVPAENLSGKWTSSPAAFTTLARTTVTWPLTDAAKAQLADIQGYLASQAACDASTPPMLTIHQMLREIEVRGDIVVMRFDAFGLVVERVVYLDAEHPANLEPSVQGHSIGRLSGDTLESDTVGFLPDRQGVGFGVPSGLGKHLVERLTLTEDRLHIRYEFTLEDPEFLAEPVSFSAVWDHRPDLQISREACDPETATRFLKE